MKIPKIFMPDKNLDAKTETFKGFEDKEPREVTLEELMKNGMRILYGNAGDDKRGRIVDEVVERAISKIIDDTFENRIKWEEDFNSYPHISKVYKAKAIILNYKREPIIIQVLFLIEENLLHKYGFLHLGDNKGPCRNTYSNKVKKLAVEYFKIKLD